MDKYEGRKEGIKRENLYLWLAEKMAANTKPTIPTFKYSIAFFGDHMAVITSFLGQIAPE